VEAAGEAGLIIKGHAGKSHPQRGQRGGWLFSVLELL